MTLNELLKIVNSNVRIQVQIEMYGYGSLSALAHSREKKDERIYNRF